MATMAKSYGAAAMDLGFGAGDPLLGQMDEQEAERRRRLQQESQPNSKASNSAAVFDLYGGING